MVMDIRESLPFECCGKCANFILDVNETTLFADDGIASRVLDVSCKNRELCKMLQEKFGVVK